MVVYPPIAKRFCCFDDELLKKKRRKCDLDHRRTRRGVGGGGRPPGLENFQGKLCFQGNRKFFKNPES